jgi:hypothetical protein
VLRSLNSRSIRTSSSSSGAVSVSSVTFSELINVDVDNVCGGCGVYNQYVLSLELDMTGVHGEEIVREIM